MVILRINDENNLKDDRWSEAETIEALREAGLVTFLDLQKEFAAVNHI